MSPSVLTDLEVPVPSSQRCEPGSVNLPFAKLPKPAVDGPVDAYSVAQNVVSTINSSLDKASPKETPEGIASLFLDGNCYWRDHLALSWDLRTAKGQGEIVSFLHNSNLTQISVDTSTEWRRPKVTPFNPKQTSNGILFYITLTTNLGSGRGVVRLVEDGQGIWKIWTIFTTLEELKGFEEPLGLRRPVGVEHGAHRGRKNWLDRRNEEVDFVNQDPDVVIIGTSHCRLGLSSSSMK